MALPRFPIGNPFRLSPSGILDSVPEPQQELEPDAPIPDPMVHGPNYVARTTEETTNPETLYSPGSAPMRLSSSNGESGESDWVDVGREAPIDFRYSHTPSAPSSMVLPHVLPPPPEIPFQPARASSIFRFVRRPKIFGPAPSEHRSTFPLRERAGTDTGGSGRGEEVPPHLRVQRAPPFVRPLTGLNHDELGSVYSEIRTWRTRLKTVNEDIRIAQEEGYQAIVDGVHVKGWLLTGRGLRLLPGIQLIEGRAKEDVRWDILQMGGSDGMNQVAFWTVVVVIAASLLLGRELFSLSPFRVCHTYLRAVIATAGLAVATSPDFAHYLPFFRSLANHNNLPTGLATVLAPSVAATLFMLLATLAIHRKYRTVLRSQQ
jgi:calcium permeable stress-gated cation channel